MSERIFEAWAPDGALWTPWAKPVLFASMSRLTITQTSIDWRSVDIREVPPSRGSTAVVVELPGGASVLTGLALAAQGYRPVPLYNANVGPNSTIDVDEIANALRLGADDMRDMRLAPDAPPAFLLDANRMRPKRTLEPGRFDNRWIVLPQDFPSAIKLASHGVREVLVMREGDRLEDDLAHVLLRWQRGGLVIQALDVRVYGRPGPIHIEPPSMFRRAWYRLIVLAGLRRANVGGFGAQIPEPSSGGRGFA